MIRSNLAVLLAERGLKITKVFEDTGISRTTLTALYYNSCKGVQLDTLNALCLYLRVDPGQMLQFVPFDISVTVSTDFVYAPEVEEFGFVSEIQFKIVDGKKEYEIPSIAEVEATISSDYVLDDLRIDIQFMSESYYQGSLSDEECESLEQDNLTLLSYLEKLPVTFLTKLQYDIASEIMMDLESEVNYRIGATSGDEHAFADIPAPFVRFSWPVELTGNR